ncbi:MAG TPA: hypothetical protein VMU21_00470 [Thermodesulfovibrionales bacterium]|nr:hypothetical protein [Thermodesulfovibrionales bacterium]
MKSFLIILLCIVMVGSLILVKGSDALETPLRTEWVNVVDVTGTFTLILYGGNYFNDVHTIAFLDLEGDQYTFEPYAPEFEYRVVKGLSAKEALDKAQDFVSTIGNCFSRSQLSKVLDQNGKTIGYEMRPFYNPICYGLSDVLDVSYWNKGGKVVIRIKLYPAVEKQLQSGDGSQGRDSGR